MTRIHSRGLKALKGKAQLIAAVILGSLPVLALLQGAWIVRNEDKFRPLLLQFQLEKFECLNCNGRGVVRDPEQFEKVEMCPVCFGVGSRQVRRFSKQENMCPACVGMGRLIEGPDGEARICRRCGGRGLIRLEAE